MKTEEVENMINEFFDGELNKAKEPTLFNLLSTDKEAREYFKQLNNMKNIVKETVEEFPVELEERIFRSIDRSTQKETRTFWGRNKIAIFAYSFAVVLSFISLVFYNQTRDYREMYESTKQQVNMQNKTIHLLMNSLPAVEVDYKIPNPVIVKANL